MTKVSNRDLLIEIYRSQLTYTNLSRAEQRALPLPNLHADRIGDIPPGHDGLVKVWDGSYLDLNSEDAFKPPFAPFQLVRSGETIASAFINRAGDRSIHGRLTDGLGLLLLRLVENYSRKPNWVGYSYREDMVSTAVVEAMVPVLRFNERKSRNPFAFLTTNTYYSFIKYQRREKALSDHRHAMVESALSQSTWSIWTAEQAEADNGDTAIYDEICAEMDLLFRDELNHRPRKQKYRLRMTPVLYAAIEYGLYIGLSGPAIAHHFGLDPATVTRVRNDIDRAKRAV